MYADQNGPDRKAEKLALRRDEKLDLQRVVWRHSGCHPKYTRMVDELVWADIQNNGEQIPMIDSVKTIALVIKIWYMDNNKILKDKKRSEKVNKKDILLSIKYEKTIFVVKS